RLGDEEALHEHPVAGRALRRFGRVHQDPCPACVGDLEEHLARKLLRPHDLAAHLDLLLVVLLGPGVERRDARAAAREPDGERARYEALRVGRDEMLADELLKQEAKARNMTPEALEKQEVDDKVAAPTDAEIQKVYDDNKEQLKGQTLDQLKPRIIEYLKGQRTAERRAAFVSELRAKHKTTIALRPPMVQVDTAGRPERGGGVKAPITIIEVS